MKPSRIIALAVTSAACSSGSTSPLDERTGSTANRPTVPASSAPPAPSAGDEATAARALLVAELRRDGVVRDPRVLDVIGTTPRHVFAPELSIYAAYQDRPQPIGHGQTISQPTIVAMMTEALELTGTERVLEIGTGSGYQAAVLARLAREVFSIEIVPALGEAARARLARLGHANVAVRIGDGYRGWPEQAPFDRIVLTAAPPDMPKALVDQLAVGGILVAPVGEVDRAQRLIRLRKTKTGALEEDLGAVRFVPMVPGRD